MKKVISRGLFPAKKVDDFRRITGERITLIKARPRTIRLLVRYTFTAITRAVNSERGTLRGREFVTDRRREDPTSARSQSNRTRITRDFTRAQQIARSTVKIFNRRYCANVSHVYPQEKLLTTVDYDGDDDDLRRKRFDLRRHRRFFSKIPETP